MSYLHQKTPTSRWPSAPGRARAAIYFVLFLASALFVTPPLGRPPGILQLVASLVCLGSLIIIARVVNSFSKSLPFVFSAYALVLLVVFFVIERLIRYAALGPQLHWLSRNLELVQLLSSIAVVMAGAVVLPHLRILKDGSASAQKEHDKFLAAAESSLDDFYIFDGIPDASGNIVDFRFSYINPNAERRLNTRRESLLGKVLTEVRPFMISSGLIEKYREVVRTGVPLTVEVFIDDEMIKATWINVQVVRLGDGIAITSRDVTERKRLTDHVSYLAHYDQLTGLPNRRLLHDRLHQTILRAQRHKQKVAVFMLDIDHFKRINDTLGHADGDALLAALAKRLSASVRETDTVARIGGDEFVIVMPDLWSFDDVKRCSLKIVESAAEPITIGDREINITVSLGLCIYPDCGLDADQLLKNADAAMYATKDSGRNGFHIFTKSMVEKDRRQAQT